MTINAMSQAKSSIWRDAPEFAIPETLATFCDVSDLWLCYAMAHTSPQRYAIVRFVDVIDHRLSPINDEGLGKHPYAKVGLQFYAFNEISESEETTRWTALKARHWAITFQDNTLDVVAPDARVIAKNLQAGSATNALIDFLKENSQIAK